MVFPALAATLTKAASGAVTVYSIVLVVTDLHNGSSLKALARSIGGGSMYSVVVKPNSDHKGKNSSLPTYEQFFPQPIPSSSGHI